MSNGNGMAARLDSVERVTQELHRRIETLTATMESLAQSMEAVKTASEGATDNFIKIWAALNEITTSHAELANELRGVMYGYEEPEGGAPEDETDEQRATRVGALARLSEMESLLRGRNRSAPTKRNMTDEDAVRVLTGDVAGLGHKEAGEAIGLTYAQVYSCRLEYTFKHVHKKLRDGGWKNAFVK